ncbi:hypothetical protein ACVGX7_00855, partial [Enterobacter hormaechei]
PGGGDGLHTVFPLKMPGGGVVFRPHFLFFAPHKNPPRASFFKNNRKKQNKKIPNHLKTNAAPHRQLNIKILKKPTPPKKIKFKSIRIIHLKKTGGGGGGG